MKILEHLLDEYKRLGIEEAVNYEEFNNILITSHSTRIEGSTLTLEESFELLHNGNTPGGKNIVFSLETIDHYEALNYVIAEARKGTPFSVGLIQTIASKVMKSTGEVFQNVLGTVDATKGEFRKTGIRAGNTSFMHYQKVEPAVNELVDVLNGEFPKQKTPQQQLELSFFAHYELVNIHPFLNGNGRTSRLLMNFIQQSYGLPLGCVFAEDKQEYYKALNSVRETDSFSDFYQFMFDQYKKHLLEEIEKEKLAQEVERNIQFRPKRG